MAASSTSSSDILAAFPPLREEMGKLTRAPGAIRGKRQRVPGAGRRRPPWRLHPATERPCEGGEPEFHSGRISVFALPEQLRPSHPRPAPDRERHGR